MSNRPPHRLGRAGVTSLEFALVAVPFLWLILAVTDLGQYFFTVQAMTTMVADMQRFMMLAPDGAVGCYPFNARPNTSTIIQPPSAPPLMLDPAQGTVCITNLAATGPANGGGVNWIQVTVQYPFVPITPGLGALSATNDGVVDNRLSQQATYSY